MTSQTAGQSLASSARPDTSVARSVPVPADRQAQDGFPIRARLEVDSGWFGIKTDRFHAKPEGNRRFRAVLAPKPRFFAKSAPPLLKRGGALAAGDAAPAAGAEVFAAGDGVFAVGDAPLAKRGASPAPSALAVVPTAQEIVPGGGGVVSGAVALAAFARAVASSARGVASGNATSGTRDAARASPASRR